MNTQISIIVPIYKAESHIHRCVDSILAQTFTDFEVILVDDGSPDNSGIICDEYEQKDSRVTVIHKENGGVSSARNAGIRSSKGEHILFIDSDDWIERNTIEVLSSTVMAENSDVVIFGCVKDIYSGMDLIKSEVNSTYKKHQLKISQFSRNFVYWINSVGMFSSWMYLFKSKIILDNKLFFNENLVLYEDFDFNLRILEKCNHVTIIPDVLYHYTLHTTINQLEKRNKLNIVSDIDTVSGSLLNFLEYTGTKKSEIKNIYSLIFPMYGLCLSNVKIHSKKTDLKTKFKILEQLRRSSIFKITMKEYGNTLRFYRLVYFLIEKKLFFIAYLLLAYKLN